MTREIKFRAKLKDTREWVYTDGLLQHKDSTVIMAIEKTGEIIITSPVIPETVGQYTGLKDKNEKEIYEGDIYINDTNTRYEVKFIEGAFCGGSEGRGYAPLGWESDDGADLREDTDNTWLTVIGNIHDNPELIK